MKILFVANGIVGEDPHLTGGETRFIEIARGWANKGHEIHLMSSKAGERLCKKLKLNVKQHLFINSDRADRLLFFKIALKSIFFLPKTLDIFNEGIVYSTNEMIFDVLPALRLKLKYRNKIKWAAVVHWLPPLPWKRKKSNIINSTLFFLNERLSLRLANRFADVLLPVSQSTAKQLSEFGANMMKVHPVDCGVNFHEIRDISSQVYDKKYDAVFMKRLQAVKGIFDLIDIWEVVVKSKPNAKLLVIGEGIDGQSAREIVKQKNLSNNIEFTGVIYDMNEKIKRLAQSKLFILPTYEENWAIVIGEAMASGTPVISYALEPLINVWGENVTFIPVGNKELFANKIVNLLNDNIYMNEICKVGIDFIKKFDWESIAEKELEYILG